MTSSHHAGEFDDLYKSTPPWDIGRPQSAFMALGQSGAVAGRVLDAGCGTGEHTLMAAERGASAVGIDTSPRAIRRAEKKANERGLSARFVVGDALDLRSLGEQFDVVLDCGLFHVFNDLDRATYASSLRAAVVFGGRYFMLCFSDLQPGDWGPRRVREAEIEACFAEGWRIDSIEPSTIEITIDPSGARAWLVSATRS